MVSEYEAIYGTLVMSTSHTGVHPSHARSHGMQSDAAATEARALVLQAREGNGRNGSSQAGAR